MYPRNNASPPPIAVGSIYLIADGTIQTSGASVRVKTAGGSWGAGGGSLDYDATSGCIEYTPTQAETNGEWFMVCVYKASCTSASITVVTTAESTAGKVSLGPSQTANIAGNITGNLSGSVGSVSGAVGSVTNLTVQAGTTLASGTHNPQTGDSYAYLGTNLGALGANAVALASQTSVNDIPTNAEFNARTLPAGSYFDPTSDTVLAYTHEGNAIPTATDVATVVAVTAKLDDTLEDDAGTYRFTTNALEQAPSDSGASAAEIVDEWEAQSQADPTGFHVNVVEVRGRTAGDVGNGNTAHFLQSADSGSDRVAREGADSDTLETLSDQVDGITGGSGGARTVTVTVTRSDTGAAIQNATVQIKSGSSIIDRQTTNASGVAAPTADDGTYTVVVSYPGLYESSTTSSYAVSGDQALAVELTPLTAPVASDPAESAVRIFTRDHKNNLESNRRIEVRQTSIPSGSQNQGFDGKTHAYRSNASGYVDLTLVRDAGYEWRYGDSGSWVSFTPDSASYNVNSDVSHR